MVTECVATYGGVSLVERRLSAGSGASPGLVGHLPGIGWGMVEHTVGS